MNEQLQLFGESILELAEGSRLDIWYGSSFADDEAQLHCTISGIDHEKGTINFWVVNGAWEGVLYPYKKLIKIGTWDEATLRQIDKFEFFDKNYAKGLNKIQQELVDEMGWDDDIPF